MKLRREEFLNACEIAKPALTDGDLIEEFSFLWFDGQTVTATNDLFGIQARGGCSCAGPYGHRLLGFDIERSHAFEREITQGCEGIKPGWVRVNFTYFLDEQVADYIIDAVLFVARFGARFLPDYRFDTVTGLWHHRAGPVESDVPQRGEHGGFASGIALEIQQFRRHDPSP